METPGGRLKRPQDLPRNQLIPAADACAWCGAPYEVRLVRLPRGSWWGEAETPASHGAGCLHRVEDGKQTIGWLVSGEVRVFRGRTWPLLRARASMSLCLACDSVLVMGGVEISIDPKAGAVEVCQHCTEALGMVSDDDGDA
jgi:hypothetical protein